MAVPYSLGQHGQPQEDNFGSKLLRQGRLWRPSWNRTDTVVRFLPTRMPNGTWSPFRESADDGHLGDWIRWYPAVRMFGDIKPVTMILYDPSEHPNYEMSNNPCAMLRDTLMTAIHKGEDRPGWSRLKDGGQGRGAACSKPSGLYLARCAIFRYKSEDKASRDRAPMGLAARDTQHFLEMSMSAGRALIRTLEERDPNYSFDGTGEIDYNMMYASGDVVHLSAGAFVTFYTKGYDPRESRQASNNLGGAPQQLSMIGRDTGGSGGRDDHASYSEYACFIEPTFKNFSPVLDNIADMIAEKDISWDRAVWLRTDEEQAIMLQERECFPADLFLHAFQSRPHWIIQQTRDRAVNRTGVLMDGGAMRTPVNIHAAYYHGAGMAVAPSGPVAINPVPAVDVSAPGFAPVPATSPMPAVTPVPTSHPMAAGAPVPRVAPTPTPRTPASVGAGMVPWGSESSEVPEEGAVPAPAVIQQPVMATDSTSSVAAQMEAARRRVAEAHAHAQQNPPPRR